LQALFATHGILDSLVSHNGSPFVNIEMNDFFSTNGAQQIISTPYHPASNGLAE